MGTEVETYPDKAHGDPFREIIGDSAAVAKLRAQLRRLFERQAEGRRLPPILLQGETGTGKGLLARAMHLASARGDRPFIELNCAAIPDTLLEAELFGFERGAFTDAKQAKAGLFQSAHHGTIFLDEIALMPLAAQGKLLKVIEDQAVRRLGSTKTEALDVWVIAATGENLLDKTKRGAFREDLYHRLAILTIALPPLRERGRDIVMLAEHFLSQACTDYGLPPKTLRGEAVEALMSYGWAGNVRELSNVMERVALLVDAAEVTATSLGLAEDLEPVLTGVSTGGTSASRKEESEAFLREHVLNALTETNWNISRAAARLRISRNTLRARITKYGLPHPISSPRTGAPRRPPEIRTAAAPPPPSTSSPPLSSLVWESRQLTFLKCEIATAQPEISDWILNEDLQLALDKSLTFGGRTEALSQKYFVAVFGLQPVEDAPHRAANAALAIQRAVTRQHARVTVVKLAIHTVSGLIGNVQGAPSIDTSSRENARSVLDTVMRTSVPGIVTVTKGAAVFLERRFRLVRTTPEGAADTVYCLAGPERSEFVPVIGTVSFAGREDEEGVLDKCLTSAMGGSGQALGIVGEPGIGKSRLVFEFQKKLTELRVRSLTAYCPSYGNTFPYLPIITLVRTVCDLTENDDEALIREKIGGKLAGKSAGANQDPLSTILALLGALPPDHQFHGLEPAQQRQRTLQVVSKLLLPDDAQQPLVFIVEDLQWADSETIAVLSSLLEQLPRRRVLMVVTYRPDHHPSWSPSYYRELSLAPLPRPTVEDILRELLGEDPDLGPVKELLLKRTQGNPFYLEETVRTLIETRALVGRWGAFTAPSPVEAVRVPPTVQAVLSARIERLPLQDKRVLQATAVIGKSVPLALLGGITELPGEALQSSLSRLLAGEFLLDPGTEAETEGPFKHSLTQDVAYESVPSTLRRAMHARIAAILEQMPTGRLVEHIDELARHSFHGALWQKAAAYFRQSAANAAQRSAYREAVLCLERALEALAHLDPDSETLTLGVDLRFQLRHALWALGELRRGLDHLREAAPLAERLGDSRRLARLSAHTSSNYLVLGDNERAREAGVRTLSIASDLGDFGLQVDARQFLGVLYNSLGEYALAIQVLGPNIEALVDARGRGPFGEFYAVHSRTWLVWSLSEVGRFGEAAARAAEARQIAEMANHPHNVIAANWATGYLNCARRTLDQAIPSLESAHALSQEANVVVWLRPSAALLGYAYVLRGDLERAVPLLEHAVAAANENKLGLAAWQTYLGTAYTVADRLDEARDLAQKALALAREHNEQGFEAHALLLLARVASRGKVVDEGERYATEALALAEDRGMRPLAALCHVALGELYRSTGKSPSGSRHLEVGKALLQELGVDPEAF